MNLWKATTIALAILLGVVVGGSFVAPSFAAPQPHMVAALDALKVARAELEKASSDKGGHRARAIDLTDKAMDQVVKGMKFDDRH